MKHIGHFWTITLFEARRFVVYPLEILGTILQRGLEAGFFIVFWVFVSNIVTENPIELSTVLSYFLIVGGITPFFYLAYGAGSHVIKMIKSGELSQVLIRPVHPLIYAFAIRTGRNGISYILGFAFVICGFAVAINNGSTPHFGYVLWTAVNAMTIGVALNIIFGAIGFYTPEATGVKNAFTHVSELLRGQKIPLFLMSAPLATTLQFTPFPASMYHFVRVLQGENPEIHFVVIGSAWALALIVMSLLFWNKTLRQYEAVGI